MVDKKEQGVPFIWEDKKNLYLFSFVFLVFLILSVLNRDLFASSWPYLILATGLIITILIGRQNHKLGMIFGVFLAILVFGLQFWYYYALPILGGYHIIITPTLIPKGMIFQMDSIFKISYYPDYPVQGNQVILTLDVCTPGQTVCKKCANCTLSAYFTNEEGNEKILFVNQSLQNQENVQFTFPGKSVNVNMSYNGLGEYPFIIPRPSLYQTIISLINEPSISMISFFSTIIGVIGIVYSIIKFIQSKMIRDNKKQDEHFMKRV